MTGTRWSLSAGTLSSTDGISSNNQLTLQFKYASIACNVDGGACVWQGATQKRVVFIYNNGGTTTLTALTIRGGNINNGGGLWVQNSITDLILVSFIDNAASTKGGAIFVDSTGSSSVTLQGCSFAGNSAGTSELGPDVYNLEQTVVIGGCPDGEGKPHSSLSPYFSTNPPPLPRPSSAPPPPLSTPLRPSSLRSLCSNPRFRPEQPQLRRHIGGPRVQLHVCSNCDMVQPR